MCYSGHCYFENYLGDCNANNIIRNYMIIHNYYICDIGLNQGQVLNKVLNDIKNLTEKEIDEMKLKADTIKMLKKKG